MSMDVLCKWMCYADGCVMQMDVSCKWMCYVNGCDMLMDAKQASKQANIQDLECPKFLGKRREIK